MSEYRTDEETVEQLRNWWNDYGTSVIVGLLLVVVGVFGWDWWQSQRQARSEGAASLYLDWQEASGETRERLAEQLLDEYPDSGYHALLSMHRAAEALEAGDAPAARTALERVLELDLPEAFEDLARVRLARLDLAADEPEAALTRLEAVSGEATLAVAAELRGDALLALGRGDEAREAYQAALLASDVGRPLLRMKLDDLALAVSAESGAPATGTSATGTSETGTSDEGETE